MWKESFIMKSFHITLASTTSSENRASNFIVNLPKPIQLDNYENWRVGLQYILYPNNWLTIPETENILLYLSDDKNDFYQDIYDLKKILTIPLWSGQYE